MVSEIHHLMGQKKKKKTIKTIISPLDELPKVMLPNTLSHSFVKTIDKYSSDFLWRGKNLPQTQNE